jgi:hypothetical protein
MESHAGRTAMISFGFSIYKFMHVLAPPHEGSPRRLGVVLAAIGTAALAAGTIGILLRAGPFS